MIIYTQGTFDLLHEGHINLLEKASKLGEVLVALLSDEAILTYKGSLPIIPFASRKRMLEGLKFVDKVIQSDNQNTRTEIIKNKVDFVIVGTDWVGKDLAKQYGVTKEWLDKYLIYFPYTDTVSTTKIKERIRNDTI